MTPGRSSGNVDQPAAPEAVTGAGGPLRRVVTNAGLLLGGRTAGAVMGLGATALAARGLGVSDLGVLVLIHAFAQFIGDVAKFQSWQTLLRYGTKPFLEGRTAEFQRVTRFTLVLDAASTVVGLAIGIAGAWFLADHLGWGQDRRGAASLYMLTIAFMVPATPVGLMRLFDRFDIVASQTALVSLLRLLACGAALALRSGLEGFLVAWAAGQVGGFVFLAAQTFRQLGRRGLLAGFAWRGPLTGGMAGVWRFAWNTNLSASLDVALTHATTLIVGALLGPASAAFWRVGRQVADGIAKPARLLAAALYPELSRLRETRDEQSVRRLALSIAALAGGAVLVLLIAGLFAGPLLLGVVLGEHFSAAASAMNWQIAALVIGAFALPLEPMLMTRGLPGAVVRVQLAVTACYLALLPLLIGGFGLIGAGVGLVLAELSQAGGWLLAIRRTAARAAPDGDLS